MSTNPDSLTLAPSTSSAINDEQTNHSKTLSGADFVQILRQGVVGDWNGRQISGDVDLTGELISKPLSIRDTVFTGTVNLSQARFERGVNFSRCQFKKLILSDARVEGPLTLNEVVIGTKAELRARLREAKAKHAQPQTVAEFDNLHIAGSVCMMNASVFGGLSCNYSEIEDSFCIDGALIYGDLSLRHTSLGELRTDGRKLFANADGLGGVKLCRVHGRLDLTSATITGDVRLIGIVVGGELTVQAANIDGNLLCRASECLRSRLRNGAWLALARIKGSVDFTGTYINGNLFLQNASVGSLLLRATMDRQKNVRCEIVRKAWMLGLTVTGDIDISGAHIRDNLLLQNANVEQNFMAKIMGGFQSQIDGDSHLNGAHIRGSVELGGAVLGGELDLDGASIAGGFAATFDLDDMADWQIRRSQVDRGIHAISATISKSVIFMGLTVGSDGAVSNSQAKKGGIDFTGAHINGELSLYSARWMEDILQTKKAAYQAREISIEKERQVSEQARREHTVINDDLRLIRAEILGDITLDGVRIEGELDLRDGNLRANINCKPLKVDSERSTLRASVHRADLETLDMTGDINLTGLAIRGKPHNRSYGDLILRDARIRGRLELCPRTGDGQGLTLDQIANIRGDLRLDAAEISHVIISGRNFEEDNENRVRVGLERATIGRLQILQPLPGKFDLSNLKVDRLDRLDDSSIYKEMLEDSYPFRKSNYLAVEKALRNAGQDGEADKVHVLMRRRDRRERPSSFNSFLRWPLDVFLDLSIKYGTTSTRLVVVMLVWSAISFWIFSNPARVEYDLSPQADKPQVVKHPDNWSRGEAALLAARLHVPIISLGVQEKVQPSGLRWKAYAITVVALSWVMWPLLIASASGLIRKRD